MTNRDAFYGEMVRFTSTWYVLDHEHDAVLADTIRVYMNPQSFSRRPVQDLAMKLA
jgi:hypothetical protein